MDESQPRDNVESLLVHRLIKNLVLITENERKLRELADAVDPLLWDKMREQAVTNEIENIERRNEGYRAQERGNMKLSGLSFIFFAASSAMALSSKLTPETNTTVANVLLAAGVLTSAFMAIKGYFSSNKMIAQREEAEKPGRYQVAQLVREEVKRRAMSGEIPGFDPDHQPPLQ